MPITGTGLAQAIIKNVGLIAQTNDPQLKLTPTGFLKLLLANPATVEINNIEPLRKGLDRTIKLRYLQRGLESEVTDRDDCDAPLGVDWKESEITHTLYSKIGIFIDDDTFRQYEEEAIQTLSFGEGEQTVPLMRGFYEVLLTKLIGLIGKIDSNLVAAQATKWGANAAYNSSTSAQTIKLGKTATLNDGYVKLQEDAVVNEIEGGLLICGNGLINRYDTLQRLKGQGADGIGSLPLNAYYDPRTISAWGANHFGAFAKGTVGFVDWNAFVGSFAGEKGGHTYFTLPVPVEIDGELSTIVFDCELFYDTCNVYESSESTTPIKKRGWNLLVSKHYGLWNLPNNAFQSGDVLYGVNGSFHYVAQEEVDQYPVIPVTGLPLQVVAAPATGANFAATVAPADGATFPVSGTQTVTPAADAIFKTQEVTPSAE